MSAPRIASFTLIAALTMSCAAAPPPSNGLFVRDIPGTQEENEPPPPCAATPTETVASAEGGVRPFDSNEALAASVGSTVYVIAPKDMGPATKGGTRHVFVFGEPVVLCRAKPLRNPGQVLSEEVFYPNNVLTKDREGHLYSLPIEMLSAMPPRFSMTSPGSAESTIVGAFSEALAAKEAIAGRPATAPKSGGRESPQFWAEKVRLAFTATQRASTEVLHHFVTARPPRVQKDPPRCTGATGECWHERSSDPKLARWFTQGIDDGGQRDAYAKLYDCLRDGKSCDDARAIVSAPPVATGAATVGGKLVVHVAPATAAAEARVDVDGAPTKLTGTSAEVTFAKDGQHTVTVAAKGKRTDTRSAIVKEGSTVELNLVLLPGR